VKTHTHRCHPISKKSYPGRLIFSVGYHLGSSELQCDFHLKHDHLQLDSCGTGSWRSMRCLFFIGHCTAKEPFSEWLICRIWPTSSGICRSWPPCAWQGWSYIHYTESMKGRPEAPEKPIFQPFFWTGTKKHVNFVLRTCSGTVIPLRANGHC